MKKIIISSILLLAAGFLYADVPGKADSIESEYKRVSRYISENHRLPDNFITKNEAKKLGWNPGKGNLWKVAPGKSIGGDRFSNREKLLPVQKGRTWYEADIGYRGGKRGKYRILYSSDGLIYKTSDHYKTFQRIN